MKTRFNYTHRHQVKVTTHQETLFLCGITYIIKMMTTQKPTKGQKHLIEDTKIHVRTHTEDPCICSQRDFICGPLLKVHYLI